MRDTSPEAQARVVQAIRARSREQRLADCIAFSEQMRELALAGLARRFPNEDRAALVVRLLRNAERLSAARQHDP
jgi:hypothetical protein